jgi:hypothetical protein
MDKRRHARRYYLTHHLFSPVGGRGVEFTVDAHRFCNDGPGNTAHPCDDLHNQPQAFGFSEDYEKKQKQYLEELEKKVKWED